MTQRERLQQSFGKTPIQARDAAELLGIAQRTVYAHREIPHLRFGRRVVFFAEDVAGFIDGLPGVTVDEAVRRTL
jgi:hypothetical protein